MRRASVHPRSVDSGAPWRTIYLQQDQPNGVPPLALTGERTLPDVPEENYWFRRHLVVYEWIAARTVGRRIVDMACGEGYGSDVLARDGASVVGVDANPEAHDHARLRYVGDNLRFERTLVEWFAEPCDAVVFLQTIEHVRNPDEVLEHFKAMLAEGGPDGVAFVSTPNVLTLAPRGRREVGQPLAPQGVPRRGVPRAVRGALRLRRAARPVPCAQAAPAPVGHRARALGRRAPAPWPHHPLLRPLHPRHQRARLRAALGRAGRGPRSRAGLPRRVPSLSARCRLAHEHRHSASSCIPTCPTSRGSGRGPSARSGCGRRWRPPTCRCSSCWTPARR